MLALLNPMIGWPIRRLQPIVHYQWSLALVFFLCQFALCQFALAQTFPREPTVIQKDKSDSASTQILDSPSTTLDTFCTAVRKKDWEQEYRCYSHSLRSRFSYFLIRSLDELDNQQDITQVHQMIVQHAIPEQIFLDYPTMRSSNATLSAEEFQKELNNRLIKWRTEVYPKVKDWPKLIRQLQPLLRRNFERHADDMTHCSQTGIVRHLDYHYFDRPKQLKVLDGKAEASIVAIVRDPDVFQDESTNDDKEINTIQEIMQVKLTKFLQGPNLRRPAEKIQLISEEKEWRISAVSYR
jgi:hypothetical protein